MKKILLGVALTIVALAFALPSFADTNAPTASAPKPPKPVRHDLTGDIKSIDATTHAVTITDKNGADKAFGLSEKVKIISTNNTPEMVSDLKIGDKVKVTYIETNGTATAVRIAPANLQKKPKKTDATN